jgi:hypothetical protein
MVTTRTNIVVFGIGTASLHVLDIAGFMHSEVLNRTGGWLQEVTAAGLEGHALRPSSS